MIMKPKTGWKIDKDYEIYGLCPYDPTVHSDFMPVFQEMCRRGKQVEQLKVVLSLVGVGACIGFALAWFKKELDK